MCETLGVTEVISKLMNSFESNGNENEKHAIALANFPTDNSSSLDVGLFLLTMNASGGDGVKGLVGYILKFV